MSVYKELTPMGPSVTDAPQPTYLGEFARILPAEEGEPTPRKWDRPDTPVKMEIRTPSPGGDEYRIVELVPTHTLIKNSGNAFQQPLSSRCGGSSNRNTRRWLLWNDPDACEVAARKVGLDLHDFEHPGVELLRFLGRELVHQNPENHDRGGVPLVEQSMSEWIDFYMGPEA